MKRKGFHITLADRVSFMEMMIRRDRMVRREDIGKVLNECDYGKDNRLHYSLKKLFRLAVRYGDGKCNGKDLKKASVEYASAFEDHWPKRAREEVRCIDAQKSLVMKATACVVRGDPPPDWLRGDLEGIGFTVIPSEVNEDFWFIALNDTGYGVRMRIYGILGKADASSKLYLEMFAMSTKPIGKLVKMKTPIGLPI